MFGALASLTYRRRRLVASLGAIVFLVAGAIGGGVADRLVGAGFDDPDSESALAAARIERATGLEPGASIIALVDAEAGVRSAATRAKVRRVADVLRGDASVGRVVTPYESRDPAFVSADRDSTFVSASLKSGAEYGQALGDRLTAIPGVKVGGSEVAFEEVGATVQEDLARAELIAFPILLLLSFWFFRSLVAALLPLMVGGLAIVGTFLVLRLFSEAMDISIFALNLTTGLGLGLAIDYSLFIVSRYREEIREHGPGPEALARTLATAGRTVLFSSLTVAAALASLLVFPQRFLYSMGLGGVSVALIAAAVALLVLPAVLALLGTRVNALAPKRLQRAAQADAQPESSGRWYRLSRFVLRRPGRVAASSAALLIALGIPFFGIEFTAVDPTVLPESSETRQVHDTLREDFPRNRLNGFQVVTSSTEAALRMAAGLRGLDGVAAVGEPQRLGERTTLLEARPEGSAISSGSQDLLEQARTLPEANSALVGGPTAEFADLQESLVSRLPLAFAIIALTTLLVLFLMTGSVVLPLKALLMNVLTLSAAFGLLVLIFQDGRLEGVLDYTSQGALESTQPVLLFAVAFGLSTDYGVFLLSRIKEARDRGAGDNEAVAVGLERTGRIITAAALLFTIAIGAFATSQIIFIKELGVGTALAVLIDATIVRALLVPSLMGLLGRWNWWAPRPLRRLHARFGLSEGLGPGRSEARAYS
jgi:uncharacterized membrane protein YdfJ with MMPL/SSD domain